MNGTATPAATTGPVLWGRFLFGKNPRWTMIRVLVISVLSVVLFRYVLLPVQVTGWSMEPTYRHGRINFINRLAYRQRFPERGDVVGIRLRETRALLLKRVVGLPGERIRIERGTVYIEGNKLEEPYVRHKGRGVDQRSTRIEPGEVYVIGDNRAVSEYGPVPLTNIVGKILF